MTKQLHILGAEKNKYMKRHYKHKEKRALQVGNTYSFFVLKKLDLPDGKTYFVVVDSNGEKHLIPEKYYNNYPIQLKSNYNCHVDKINCQGRIFLEPEHPKYKIGQEDVFRIGSIVKKRSKKGRIEIYYKMIARDGQIAFLPEKFLENKKFSETIHCKVASIKKSSVYLEI
jgi:hypothetical protein